jgi:hypothetical protein
MDPHRASRPDSPRPARAAAAGPKLPEPRKLTKLTRFTREGINIVIFGADDPTSPAPPQQRDLHGAPPRPSLAGRRSHVSAPLDFLNLSAIGKGTPRETM